MLMVATKVCGLCQTEKPITAFHKRSATAGGRQSRCSECASKSHRQYREADLEGYRARARAVARRVSDDPERRAKRNHAARCYQRGITVEKYDEMFKVQKGRCAMCRDKFADPLAGHIDHDHATGQVRGLLCRDCNLALGFLRDSPKRAQNAAAYLRRWSPSS